MLAQLTAVLTLALVHAETDAAWEADTLAGTGVAFSDECTITTVDSLTPEEFQKTYWKKKPVVIRGGASAWNPAWASKGAFLGAYGAARVQAGAGHELTRDGGVMPREQVRSLDEYFAGEAQWHDFVAQSGSGTNCSETASPQFVFDAGDVLSEDAAGRKLYAEVAAGVAALPVLPAKEPVKAELCKEFLNRSQRALCEKGGLTFGGLESQTVYLAAGSRCAGLPWHGHAEAWSTQLVGSKHWLVYARPGPHKSVPYWAKLSVAYEKKGQQIDLWSWMKQIYLQGKLSGKSLPLECTLHAGDVIYLPRMSMHTTINIGDSISLSGQSNIDLTPTGKLTALGNRRLKQGRVEDAEKAYREAVLGASIGDGKDLYSAMHLYTLLQLDRCAEALKMRDAYNIEPWFIDAVEKGADIVAGVERCQDELSSPTEEQPATSMDSHGGGYDATASSQAGPDPVDDVDPEDDEKEL